MAGIRLIESRDGRIHSPTQEGPSMGQHNALLRSRKKKALALLRSGELTAARDLYVEICRREPSKPEGWLTLGALHGRLGDPARAAECFRHAIALDGHRAGAHYNLGVALGELGRAEESLESLRRALSIEPGYTEAALLLAHGLAARARAAEAAEALRGALRHRPGDLRLLTNLGAVLQALGELTEAESCWREALRLYPGEPRLEANLVALLCAQGRVPEAASRAREALTRQPHDHRLHSNLLLTLHYLPDLDDAALYAEHRRWGERQGCGTPAARSPQPSDPDRRLRVGYVSADFRRHSVACFLEPLLAHHDRAAVEVFCYSDVTDPDAITARFRTLADVWRDTAALDDAALAARVRADGIDVLVDLAGHTAGGRLRAFALKPAPVQIAYLGYPDTTGLDAIDYRLTDAVADPPGAEQRHTEALLRLPRCFLCYRPPPEAPPVADPPVLEAGRVTFGSFNHLAKINDALLDLWADLLRAVPESRLLLKNHSLTDAAVRARLHGTLRARGVDPWRVELRGHVPGLREHLAAYADLDVALDTFPYNGTTTTCEALWMGVPVVTLIGTRHAARVGPSLLAAIGHPEWAAHDPADYLRTATALAADPNGLAHTRRSLRTGLTASALCDAAALARSVEAAYRATLGRPSSR